jgi:toxin YoeB
MNIQFTPKGWEDYTHWVNDPDTLEKINNLIKDIQRNPFNGLGKPEPLKFDFKGYWSRRITGEHRLVYSVSGTKPNQVLIIISARFHYS